MPAPAFQNRNGRRNQRRGRREFQEREGIFWRDRNPAGERSSPGFYDCLLRIRTKSLRRGRTCFASTTPDSKRLALSSRPCWRWRRSEEHTSELQSHSDLVCRLLLEKKKKKKKII